MNQIEPSITKGRHAFFIRMSANAGPRFKGGPYLLSNHQHLFPMSLYGLDRRGLGIPYSNLGHQLKYLDGWVDENY